MEVQHYIHKHPMTQYDLDKERLACSSCNTPYKLPDYYCPKCNSWLAVYCPGCGDGLKGKTCVCKECIFYVHRECADKWPQQIDHPFHPLHPLQLHYRSTDSEYIRKYKCSACHKMTRNFVYHCVECSFGLCLDCVSLNPEIKMEDGNHILHLYENTTFRRWCFVCHERDRHTFIFICMIPKCGYAVHLHCAQLSIPETVKHKYHYHRLSLVKSNSNNSNTEADHEEDRYYDYSGYEEGESDEEYYCDACEMRRNKDNPVYYCEECEFSAHVGCGIAEELPSLVAEYESSLRSKGDISDPYLEKIDSELMELRKEVEEIKSKLEALPPKRKELEEERSRLMASTMPPSTDRPVSA